MSLRRPPLSLCPRGLRALPALARRRCRAPVYLMCFRRATRWSRCSSGCWSCLPSRAEVCYHTRRPRPVDGSKLGGRAPAPAAAGASRAGSYGQAPPYAPARPRRARLGGRAPAPAAAGAGRAGSYGQAPPTHPRGPGGQGAGAGRGRRRPAPAPTGRPRGAGGPGCASRPTRRPTPPRSAPPLQRPSRRLTAPAPSRRAPLRRRSAPLRSRQAETACAAPSAGPSPARRAWRGLAARAPAPRR